MFAGLLVCAVLFFRDVLGGSGLPIDRGATCSPGGGACPP
jgi:hypothetical protein